MPYSTKWKISSYQVKTGHQWIVYIEDRELDADDITVLDPGPVPIEISYRPIGFYAGSPHWNLATSTCTITFLDTAAGVLSEILDADDERYRIRVEGNGSDEWLGFVLPDSYSYSLYGPTVSRLRAADRLEDLQNIPYSIGGGLYYGGRLDLLTVLTQCLDSTGLGLGLSTHCNWYPHIGANELDTSDDPLVNLKLDQDNLFDSDGNPYSKFTVLDQICRRFSLQLFQSEKRWFLQHRRKNVSAVTGNYTVFQYDSDATPDSGDATLAHTARVNVGLDANWATAPVAGASVAGTTPYGLVRATYLHGNPFLGLMHNLSFEDGLEDTVGGTPLLDGAVILGQDTIDFDGVTASVNIPADRRFTIAGDTTEYRILQAAIIDGSGNNTTSPLNIEPKIQVAAADNTAMEFHEDHYGWERFNSTHNTTLDGQGLTEDDNVALKLACEFNTAASYQIWVRQESTGDISGTTGLYLKTGWWVRSDGGEAATTSVLLPFKLYVYDGTTTWWLNWSDSSWNTSDPGFNEVDLWSFGWLDGSWHHVDVFTSELHDGSNDIAGRLTIEFWEPREHDDTTNSSTVSFLYVDNVDYPLITDANGIPSDEALRTLITYSGNVNRGEPAEPTFVMGDGPTTGHISRLTVLDSTGAEQSSTGDWSYLPTVASSGLSLDQFWAHELFKEFRQANKKIRGTLYTSAASSPPKPHQYFVFTNPSDTTAVDYTWQDLSYRPANHDSILSGSFIEYQVGNNADRICTVNIKPNTQLLAGIPKEQGLVCDATSVFSPPTTADTIYYLDSNKRVRSAPIDPDNEPWTPTTLWSAGRTPTILRVDQAAGYAFVKESTNNVADYIKRYDLATGSNGTDIVTESWAVLDIIKDFRLDTANQLVYVLNGFGATEEINVYDYEGSLQDTITLTDNSSVGQLAFDGDYLMYQATTDKLYKVVISTGTETLVDNLTSPDNSQNSAALDLAAGYYFYYHDSAGIRRTDAPDGGNETQIEATAVDQSGLEIDRVNQLLYFGSTDRIVEIAYDGTGNRTVVDQQADTYNIRSISLGI